MKQLIAGILFFTSLVFIISSCARDRTGNKNISSETVEKHIKKDSVIVIENENIQKAHLKLYVENTASMDGYIDGRTRFKDVLRQLLIEIDNENSTEFETEFFLVNDRIKDPEFTAENTKIVDELTLELVKSKGEGSRGNSNFDQVLKMILENQENNDLSILAADLIYSPEDGETEKRLTEFRDLTKDAFLKARVANKELETTILRFKSDFTSVYYDINNDEIDDISERPFYLMIFGNRPIMDVFHKKILPELEANVNFEESFHLNNKSGDDYSISDYTVLTTVMNSTLLQPIQVVDSKTKSIEPANIENNSDLQFALAVDLSQIPASKDYLMDISNYKTENYSIEKIGVIRNNKAVFENSEVTIPNAELAKLEGLSHIILVSSTGSGVNDLTLKLVKNIPPWVQKYSNADDTDIATNPVKQNQTFGFSYLVEGLQEAYQQDGRNQNFFALTVPVQAASPGSGLGTIFWVVLLIILLVGIIFIIKNNKSRR